MKIPCFTLLKPYFEAFLNPVFILCLLVNMVAFVESHKLDPLKKLLYEALS